MRAGARGSDGTASSRYGADGTDRAPICSSLCPRELDAEGGTLESAIRVHAERRVIGASRPHPAISESAALRARQVLRSEARLGETPSRLRGRSPSRPTRGRTARIASARRTRSSAVGASVRKGAALQISSAQWI
ncbi:hypothetical protein VT73_01375 [Rathayibacter toxicus]|uniref:Uncharacterized protein n=1 Tax=Rathayibacter toxicus TaxID=145458 RepID=A0A0C5BI23_9MICO|nr:hypothetical protein TI83_08235 [Rathayibacter toxicus]KKM46945.1 hypothetical protein VT73_01375 [Rathayibacter toxicus]